MRKKLAFRKKLALMRRLLCLFISMTALFASFSGLQEYQHDNPRATLSLALNYLRLSVYASTNCALSPGASVSTIQAVFTAGGSGTCTGTADANTILFQAGTYPGITSTLSLPCNAKVTGPILPYSQTHYQTAILQGSASYAGQPIHTTAGCGSLQNISYLEWNGLHPVNGGGFIYVTPGTTNLKIDHNWIHGSNAQAYSGNTNEAGVLLDGTASSSVTSNVTITYNEFGAESYSDCGYPNGAMNEPDTEGGGGFCAGVISQGQTNHVSIDHNIFRYLEQGGKVVEACSGCGGSPSHGNTQNFTMSYNAYSYIYRIFFETQSNFYNPSKPTLQFIQYNFLGQRANTGGGGQQDFELSIANGCGNPPATPNCTAHVDYNFDLQAVQNSVHSAGNEFWGDSASTGNYNLMEGYVAGAGGGFLWAQSGQMTLNNNTFNMHSGSNTNCQTATGGYWNNEDSPAGKPSCTANTYSAAGIGTYASCSPTVSPATGGYTFPITVTITNLCLNRDTNTTDWCTTDGTNPVPGSGTALPYGNGLGTTFTQAAPGTVKCVGMWGALNQPYSYPSGYGYVPSAIISNNYTSSGPTAATPIFSPLSENYTTSLSVSISDSTSGSTIHYTTDGSVPTTASAVYSGAFAVTAQTTTVKAIATASGFAQSLIASATYVNTAYVATPTFSPGSENFTGTLSVSITDTTSGASIYYTTDGSTPSTSGGGGSSGATYYLSPSGSDSNSGTSSGSPWLSPNHALNCGDQIIAASGTYSSANFYNGKWGTVTCAAANNVAWLKCVTFDTCKISATTQQGMYVSSSYWGIQGWEITDSWTFGNCYYIQPTTTTDVHHVIFANDIANGCAGGGFVAFATSASLGKVDYIALVGDIAYGTSSANSVCASGFSLGFLPQFDSVAGTHLFIAGNYAWNNFDPATCASTAATDGEGIIIDTLRQFTFNQQVAVENNITVGNGGRGILQNNNDAGSPATVFLNQNTSYGNNLQAGQAFPTGNGELMITVANDVTATNNLAMTSQATTGGHPIYAFSLNGSGNTVLNNWLYSAAGNTTIGSGYGTNVTGSDPAFANPVIPGAPNCSGTANVPACVATLIANFTPTASGTGPYGYQPVVTTPVTDPLFPTWLCNTNLPAGLVSTPCTPTSELYTGPFTISATTTVKALAAKPGFTTSPIAVGTYTVSSTIAATPTFSPDSETYVTSVSVTLADTTSGASIYYTTDGSTPTTSSTLYSAPFVIAGGIGLTTTVNAIAVAPGFTNSPVATATYLNNPMVTSTPTFSPDSEDFTTPITVTIADATSGSTIYYTRDGTTPTTASSVYSTALPVATSTTLKAIAVAPGFSTSAVGQAVYATSGNQSNPPVIIPGPQMFSSSITASIASAPSNPGATIYYTTDGSAPTTGSTVYHGPIHITATTTLNAIEVYGSLLPSLVASCTYTLGSCPGCWWTQ